MQCAPRVIYSDYAARAVATLAIATGNIGVPGGGISLHGGTYPVPLNQRNFRSPDGKTAATLDIITLMSAIETGHPYPVKALVVSASNLFNQTSANRRRVMSEILPKLEFIAVSEHFMTATAEMADLVLPACTIFEKTDLIPGIFLQLQQKAVEPEGESKSDFDLFRGLAERMGFGDYFRAHLESYLEEMLVHGQTVRVYNDRGSVKLKCRINPGLHPGVLVIPEGYWVKDFPEGEPYSLTHDLVSPTSENYAFYDTLVEVEAI